MVTMLDPGSGGLPAPEAAKFTPGAPLGLPPAQEQTLYGKPLAGAEAASPMMKAFGGVMEQAQAQYSKLAETATRLGVVRQEMDKLVAMGDQVTQENVVSAAGLLVAHGIGAVPMATLLADMPKSGEALQDWLRQQDQIIHQNEQKIQMPLAQARHQLAMAGLHNLVGHMAEAHGAKSAEGQGPLGPQGGAPAAAALSPPVSNDLAPASGGQEAPSAG